MTLKYQAVILGLNNQVEAKFDEDRVSIIERHGNNIRHWQGKVIILNVGEAQQLAYCIAENYRKDTRKWMTPNSV